MFKKDKPFKATEADIKRAVHVYCIPEDLIEQIYKLRTTKYSIFGEKLEYYSESDYDKILYGASIAYKEQKLLGRIIPLTDDRCMRLCTFMKELGISIEYHPKHGMTVVDTTNKND